MNSHAVPPRRLVTAIVASVAGVLATAVLWKPGVLLGAVIVPVIAELVQLTFPSSAPMTPQSSATATTPRPSVLRRAHRSELRTAVASGLVGAAIVGSIFTLPSLASGKPLTDTPLFGGKMPLIEPSEPAPPGNEKLPGRDLDPPNPEPDTDSDGIADASDNCPTIANKDQADTNGTGRGDACDPDDDNDGVNDEEDNCRTIANKDQADTNGTGRGDACDPDDDNDGVNDEEDNCRTIANKDQEDTNGNGRGDACDPDGTPNDHGAFSTDATE